MNILGVDVGQTGAFCVYNTDSKAILLWDMPIHEVTVNHRKVKRVSAVEVALSLRGIPIDHAFVELVSSMPNQGVSSMFTFGKSAGIIEGVLGALSIPVTYVTPQKWIKVMGVKGGKDGSRQRASELLPEFAKEFKRVKDNGRSDACLIALYGAYLLRTGEA
jgi:crossover junction endodeoxyribonuclease RuvC